MACQSLRERAILEFLYSTGCRVGEVEKINIQDLNWENCSAIINGKGSLFHDRVQSVAKEYLASHEDNCNALIVTDTHPSRHTL
ncbi:site-specific integrase [Paenibacillus sp. ISL-20]|uniref:site-specific integrase n=1 Tax=Paenibacillus sp. ISL-20 TaxID=2819163 RepID=UPI003334BFE5